MVNNLNTKSGQFDIHQVLKNCSMDMICGSNYLCIPKVYVLKKHLFRDHYGSADESAAW